MQGLTFNFFLKINFVREKRKYFFLNNFSAAKKHFLFRNEEFCSEKEFFCAEKEYFCARKEYFCAGKDYLCSEKGIFFKIGILVMKIQN